MRSLQKQAIYKHTNVRCLHHPTRLYQLHAPTSSATNTTMIVMMMMMIMMMMTRPSKSRSYAYSHSLSHRKRRNGSGHDITTLEQSAHFVERLANHSP